MAAIAGSILATWAATLPSKACQITFFGMEENTDWGMRRKGAFRDQLAATERCIEAGIAPRWQLFITKRCLGELKELLQLMHELDLFRRCGHIGGKFEFFIGGISPEGCGYEIENVRLEQSDLELIPHELIALSRDGLNMLGQPECDLLGELTYDDNSPLISANFPCVAVDADLYVYPNIAEPAEWWRLGNLKIDGVDAILKAYREGSTPGMKANNTIPMSELVRRYGDPNSKKLYSKSDLVCRFIHQWGVDYLEGNCNI